MSELPAAEAAADVDVGDPNEGARRGQSLKWAVGILVLAVGFMWFVFQQFAGGSNATAEDDPVRISATAEAAAAANASPEQRLQELQAQNQGLSAELARVQNENVSLAGNNQQLQGELQTTSADARSMLDAAVQTRTVEPPPVGYSAAASGGAVSPVQGGAAPPPMPYNAGGPNPFASNGAGMGSSSPGGAADAAPPARPRRTMGIVRAARSGVERVSNTAGGADARPVASAGAPEASSDAARGGGQAAPGSASYFSGALQTFESARYVPPNAYARAKVLVGVDATAAVGGGSDPKPVLFRLTGPAIHVGTDGKFQTTDLRGCQVNGAAYGELSSEKVYIKLQRITCPQ